MASGPTELDSFVRDALLRGQSRDSILQALRSAGWSEQQLAGVLDAWAEVDYPVPVPRPRASLSARDAFMYLVLFCLLYFLCFHLGSLLFDLVNAAVPDPAADYRVFDFAASTRFSTAALIITFPLFAFMAHLLGREVEQAPIKRLSPIRRWLTYLTLFVSAGALVGDMTALVYNLLGGELTIRFVLKVLVVALIAGSVFGFYLWDLRRDESQVRAWRAWGKRLLLAAGLLALGALAGGFALMGSPSFQRDLRMDERRVADLQALENAVEGAHRETGTLPPDLATLSARPGLGLSVDDPVTGAPYTYRVESPTRYVLCASFAMDSAQQRRGRRYSYLATGQWPHGVGEACFTRRVQQTER